MSGADLDDLPRGAIARLGSNRFRIGSAIDSLALSPTEDVIACADRRNALHFLDAHTGLVQRTVADSGGVVFSPDWKYFARPESEDAHLCDLNSGKVIRVFKGQKGKFVGNLTFSPNGNLLAAVLYEAWTNNAKIVILWDWCRGVALRTIAVEQPCALAFSPDAKSLLTGCFDGTLHMWNVESGQLRFGVPGHRDLVQALTFSPCGKMFASCSYDPGRGIFVQKAPPPDKAKGHLCLWDASNGRLVFSLKGHEQNQDLTCIEFSPDGKLLASGDTGGSILLWDTATGRTVRKLEARSGVRFLRFADNGKTLLSAHDCGAILRWEADTGKLIDPDAAKKNVSELVYSPCGRYLISAGDEVVRVWDLTSKQARMLVGHKSAARSLAISRDGRTLASGGWSDIRVWDLASGTERHHFKIGASFGCGLAFSPQGELIATPGEGKTVRVFDPGSGKELRRQKAQGEYIAISPDGKLIVSGEDFELRSWNGATGRLLAAKKLERPKEPQQELPPGVPPPPPSDWRPEFLCRLAFLPDSEHFAAALPGVILVLRSSDLKEVGKIATPTKDLTGIAISHDGKHIASFASYEENGVIRVWDWKSGREVWKGEGGHYGGVTSLAFSPDSKVLASGGADTSILLWDTASLRRE